MDDLPIMDMFHAETNLGEPIENLVLGERPASLILNPLL